jgi:hypothetical protein
MRLLVGIIGCLLALWAIAGCAERIAEQSRGIYYKPVPDALTRDIGVAFQGISDKRRVTTNERRALVSVVKQLKENQPVGLSERRVVLGLGDAAFPVFAELLNSQSQATRMRALLALGTHMRMSKDFTPVYLTQTEPAIALLCRRSMFDKDYNVRARALACFCGLGTAHDPDRIPAGVVAGLEQGLRDPDRRLRDGAFKYKQIVGLLPMPPHEH